MAELELGPGSSDDGDEDIFIHGHDHNHVIVASLHRPVNIQSRRPDLVC